MKFCVDNGVMRDHIQHVRVCESVPPKSIVNTMSQKAMKGISANFVLHMHLGS